MNVMIIFETIEGQTGRIVRFIEGQLEAKGHKIQRIDTAHKRVNVSFEGVDKVILAAPVHERRHPEAFEVFVSAARGALNAMDTLMLSVSLKAAFADGLEEAEDFLCEMEMRTKFSARDRLLVAGAVRQGSYDYFASQILQFVVLDGQDVNLADGDHEFTDWDAVGDCLDAFISGATV